jgi:hypothetical protein
MSTRFSCRKIWKSVPENDFLYQEKSILIMYIDCDAIVSKSMWMKSVLQFASNYSQNYVFRIRATDQYRFLEVFQASFADWYLFIQDRIFNVP